MDFKRIRNSLDINSKENPSIFMALCLMETLLADFQEETGKDISELDIGDETLSLKLTLIYRNLKKIYDNNKDSFTRGVSRLEKMISEADDIEQELNSISVEVEKLSALKKAAEEKRAAYELAKKQKLEYDSLTEEIRVIESRIREYEGCNPENLKGQMQTKASELEALEGDMSNLVAQIDDCNSKISSLTEGKNKKEIELQMLSEELSLLSKSNEDITNEIELYPERKRKLLEDTALKKNQLHDLQEELDEYYSRESMPLESEIQVINERISKARAEAELKGDDIKKLEEQYKQLVINIDSKNKEIAKLSGECESRSALFAAKSNEFQAIQNTWFEVNANYKNLIKTMDERILEIEDYSSNKIPEAQKSIDENTATRDALIKKLSALYEEKDSLAENVVKIEENIKPLETEVERLTDLKSALTADYGNKSNQIKKLEAELEELTGKTDVEKLNNYEIQLKKNIDNLNNVEIECTRLEEEIEECKASIEGAMLRKKQAEEQKKKLDDSMADLQALNDSLAAYDTPEFRRELENVNRRLMLLKGCERKLMSTINLISKHTGVQVENLSRINQLNQNISSLSSLVNKHNEELLECSKLIKLEERE